MTYTESDLPELATDYATSELFTPADIPLTEIARFTSGQHFQVYREKSTGHFYWEGLNEYDRLECDEVYTELAVATADSIFWLMRYTGYDYEASQTHVYELGLPNRRQPEDEPEFIITRHIPDSAVLENVRTLCRAYRTTGGMATHVLSSIMQVVGE